MLYSLGSGNIFIILFNVREVWPLVQAKLTEYKLKCELDVIEGSMTVLTTRKTWDPYIIIKVRNHSVIFSF